ncbi:MAG: hypothetical protein ACOC3I_00940 [Verrucomicrobiota bacterium]
MHASSFWQRVLLGLLLGGVAPSPLAHGAVSTLAADEPASAAVLLLVSETTEGMPGSLFTPDSGWIEGLPASRIGEWAPIAAEVTAPATLTLLGIADSSVAALSPAPAIAFDPATEALRSLPALTFHHEVKEAFLAPRTHLGRLSLLLFLLVCLGLLITTIKTRRIPRHGH